MNTKDKLICLNDKIDVFVKWYFNNSSYGDVRSMKNLIEKMAVWYELKYPDYEVNRLIPGSAISENEMDEDMRKVYDTKSFIEHLTWDERKYFNPIKYHSIYCYKEGFSNEVKINMDNEGNITKSSGLSRYTDGRVSDEFAEELSLKKLYKYLEFKGINLRDSLLVEIKQELDRVDKEELLQGKLLDSIMWRIIERGGCRMGSRRGLMFAKEFDRDISVPMKYVDMSDPGLDLFINEYLELGGDIDINCYKGYDFRKSDEDLKTIPLRELIKISISRNIHPQVDSLLEERVNEKKLIKK